MRIAVVKEGFGQTAETWAEIGLPPGDPVVDRKVRAAIAALEQRGAVVTEVSVPMHITAMHIWYPIFLEGTTEFMVKGNGIGTNWMGYYNTQLADVYGRGWRSRPDALPHGVKSTLLLGEYMHRKYHGRYYAKAQNLRYLVNQAFDEVARIVRRHGDADDGHPGAADPRPRLQPRGVDVRDAAHDPQHAADQSERPSGDQRPLRHGGRLAGRHDDHR